MPPKRIKYSRSATRNDNFNEIIYIENPAHGTRPETGPTGLSNLNAKTHLERTRRQSCSRGGGRQGRRRSTSDAATATAATYIYSNLTFFLRRYFNSTCWPCLAKRPKEKKPSSYYIYRCYRHNVLGLT